MRLLDLAGQPMSVKRITRFEARTVAQGAPAVWTNNLPVEGRAGPDAIIDWRHLVGRRGDRVDFVIETDEGTVVRGSGALPDDGTNLLVVRADDVGGLETKPDATVPNVQAGWVTGRVVTPEGEPIAGASLEMPGANLSEGKPPQIQTDAQGLFRFPKPGPRYSYTRIEKAGWAALLLTDLPVGNGFHVALRKDGGLRGKVAGGDGVFTIALKKNKVTHNEITRYEVPDAEIDFTTDGQGNYDVPVEPGHYRWEAENAAKTQFGSGEIDVVAGQWVELKTSLGGGCTVTLELVDCETGKPVPGIEVSLREGGVNRQFVERPASKQTSDAEGRIRWENLAPGQKQFMSPRMWRRLGPALQEPYSRWWWAEEPEAARRVDYAKAKPVLDQGVYPLYAEATPGMPPLRILLERGAKISGQVLTPDGQPAVRLAVAAAGRMGARNNALGQYGAVTDAEGKYLLYLPAGNGATYSLYAGTRVGDTPPGTTGAPAVSPSFEVKSGEERVFDLRQPVGGWITGRVVSAAATLPPGARVIARAQGESGLTAEMRIARPAADGHFRLGPLRVGRYKLETTAMNGMQFVFENTLSQVAEITADGQEVEVPDLTFQEKSKEN